MATVAGDAPSTRVWRLQFGSRLDAVLRLRGWLEGWFEAERDQLPLWLPVAVGAGIALWFVLPSRLQWWTALAWLGAAAVAGAALSRGGRGGRALLIGALAVALGLALIWWRAELQPPAMPGGAAIPTIEARVERIEPLVARQLVRLRLTPLRVIADPAAARQQQQRQQRPRPAVTLPSHLRVNLEEGDVPVGLAEGAVIRLQARLMPPPGPSVPGAYDYARVAWFDGLGATGRGFAPVTIVTPAAEAGEGLRQRLSRHIQASAPGSPGGIAAALATGDQGSISEEDAQAMRRSGLAHLLSVSGLHITAAVAATMFLTMRLLALFPRAALRLPLPLFAAGAGAVAAIGYTWLTGAEVPTLRSCVAALLVIAALALGREAVTLRLVAAGALLVLLLYPEAIAGPSFQLSFAAVTAIISLHEHPRIREWFGAHEEPRWRRMLRALGSLLLTGLVVEIALIPIGLYHFHKAGLFGAGANIVAIPLTTFVTMPAEALALLFDLPGWGAPFWWVTARSLDLLLWIAHHVAALPGSVQALPAMPDGAYALMVMGGLWIALWRTRWRRLGAVPLTIGALWALATPMPDVLVTGDGRHVAVRQADGSLALLRDRTGDYTSSMLAEVAGTGDLPVLLSDLPTARCSNDLCLADVERGGRHWRVLATRSSYPLPTDQLTTICAQADVVVSERRLPDACRPRWLKLDQPVIAHTGGLAITFGDAQVRTVRQPGDDHPWRRVAAPTVRQSYRRSSPARRPWTFTRSAE